MGIQRKRTTGAQHPRRLACANTHGTRGIQYALQHKVVSLAAGRVHSVAVTMEGELWVWGFGHQGQLGLGDHMD